MKPLILDALKAGAADFLKLMNEKSVPELFGVTDGKAVGTYVEHAFHAYLQQHYIYTRGYTRGSSASGIDFPQLAVDLKVTSIRQPQSSCPYQSAAQKVYGLGYHLMVLIYDKKDHTDSKAAQLNFQHAIFIHRDHTGDYQTTRGLLNILAEEANLEDIIAFLEDRNLPLDEIGREQLARQILQSPPEQGFLTISNALQMAAAIWPGRFIKHDRCIGYRKSFAGGRRMSKRAFGDFQTPMPLVESIVSLLKLLGIGANRVIEPTCGRGNFIHGLLNAGVPPAEIVGVEISQEYVAQARLIAGENGDVRILQANIFDMDFGHDLSWQKDGDLLVVGNPPWVTNAALGLLESDNLPAKRNLKNLPGIDALTGASNFDLAEAIWIKLIWELYDQKPVIALLCKTSVARNVLQYVRRHQIAITDASIRLIDAKRWFNAAVDACLFTMSVNRGETCYEVEVYESLSASQPQSRMGFIGDSLIPDLRQYTELQYIEGKSPYVWRQGIKHDAASVMELIDRDGNWYNALDERVEIEERYLYPLLKSSDMRSSQRKLVKRAVIVPQRYVGENTWMLRQDAPKLWRYLNQHVKRFELRKSSIYKGKPPFSIFGVGSYTFSPYKVCVSGLYKIPHFKAVGLRDGRPFVCDDTCYLLPFNSASQAARTAAVLNHPVTIRFLNSITFWDSKRPITKSLLSRINLDALIERLPEPDIRYRTEKILDEMAANGEIETLESDMAESPAQLRLL